MSEHTRTIDGHVLPAPGTWVIDPVHSHPEFSVRHMMVGKTRGRFGKWSGVIVVAEDPASSSVEITIDAASIDTRDETRDNHLRSADFLDVEKYPTLTFRSTKVSGRKADWTVLGDLSIHGVTKEVELDLEFEGVMDKDAFGSPRAAFSGETEINREDFGLTWNVALEAGGVLVGKTVKISFEVEATRQADA